VELKDQSAERLLDPILARLRNAGAADEDQSSKLVRALGARATAVAEVDPLALTAASTAAELIRHAIAVSVASLMRHDPGVRLGDDPEDVHRARVATRRLRSQLRTFGTLLDAEWANALREDLRWLGAGLGSVRDRQVMAQRFRSRTSALAEDDAPVVAELAAELHGESEEARGRLVLDMRSDRYIDLIERLVEASGPPTRGDNRPGVGAA
jgi:inorganic triphosphatase YgiF